MDHLHKHLLLESVSYPLGECSLSRTCGFAGGCWTFTGCLFPGVLRQNYVCKYILIFKNYVPISVFISINLQSLVVLHILRVGFWESARAARRACFLRSLPGVFPPASAPPHDQ